MTEKNFKELFEEINENIHFRKLYISVYKKLENKNDLNILEFGVSEQAMTTKIFLELLKKKNGKLYSVDIIDYSNKFNENEWTFINCRDDEYEKINKFIPKKLDVILLDTLHNAKHVEKIFYNYFKRLKKNGIFYIDDISWIPYIKSNRKDNNYIEINNQETFEKLLEIYNSNLEKFDIEFNFIGTGLAIITKKNEDNLIKPEILKSRKYSLKNIIKRKIGQFK